MYSYLENDDLAKGFALDIPAGYGSQKSGVRSQNDGAGSWLGFRGRHNENKIPVSAGITD
jgi:hypothetical protein